MIMQQLRNSRLILLMLSLVILSSGCSNFRNSGEESQSLDDSKTVEPSSQASTQEAKIEPAKPVVIYSTKAVAFFNQAMSYLQKPDVYVNKARQAFNQAITLEPKMEAAYYNLMRIAYDEYSGSKQQKKGLVARQMMREIMQRAEIADILSARMLTLAGTLERQLGQFNDAKILYLKALEKQGNYLALLANLAILEDIYLGNLNKAQQYYQQYQTQLVLQGKQDKGVKNWLSDIKRRIAKQNKAAS